MNAWYLRILKMILGVISGPLREELVTSALAFRVKARETDNPWDDILADMLCWALNIE